MLDSVRVNFSDDSVWLLNIVIGLIMFGVALDLRAADFTRILRRPKAPLIGLLAQLALFPAITYLLTLLLDPAPSVALGMILIAACPSGNVSNFLTLLANGNTALSVTMTTFSTVAAVITTPINLAIWGSLNPNTAKILKNIELDPFGLFETIVIILGIPTALGMTFAYFFPGASKRLHKPFRAFSIAAFLSFVAIAFSRNVDVFIQHIHRVAFVVFVHNAVALALGYYSAYMSGLPEADRRAISIEVGIQNSALGLVLVFRYFDGMGGMALVAAWWGIWHVVGGLVLASLWARRPMAAPASVESDEP